jgi:hypothetical protein
MEKTDDFSNPEWVPAQGAWKQFCAANPGLGLKGTRGSYIWFTRTAAPALIEAGVMRRSKSRALLINTKSFAPVAFELLTTGGAQGAAS